MRKPILTLCAIALALSGTGCGDPGGEGGRAEKPETTEAPQASGAPESLVSLAAAADEADEAGSAHIVIRATVGAQAALSMEGGIDFETEAAALTMDAAGFGLGPGTLQMVMKGKYIYMKFPPGAGILKGWFRMDIADLPGSESGMSLEPSQYLEFLREAAEDGVEEAGTEEIDGDETTQFQAEISLETFLAQMPKKEARKMRKLLDKAGDEVESIPIAAWIDEDGLPRRITVEFPAGPAAREILMTAEFSDYGVPVDVKPPKRFKELPGM